MKRVLLSIAAFAGSAVMLTVIQPPFDFALLAWVAYVPFILVCSGESTYGTGKGRGFYIISYVVSVCYWLGNLYWLGPVTFSGWVAFCLYTGLLWPLLAVGLRYCMAKKFPLFFVVGLSIPFR